MAKLSQLFGGNSSGGYPFLPTPPSRIQTTTRYVNFADDLGSSSAAVSPLIRLRSVDVDGIVANCNLNFYGTAYSLTASTPTLSNINPAYTINGVVSLYNRVTRTTLWSATYSSISQSAAGNTSYTIYSGGAYVDKSGGFLYLPLSQSSGGTVLVTKISIASGTISGLGATLNIQNPSAQLLPQYVFGSKLISTVFADQPTKLYIMQSMNPTVNSTTFNTVRINLSTGTSEGNKSVTLYTPVGNDWISCKYVTYDRSVIITDCSTPSLSSDYFEMTIVRGFGSIRLRVPKEFPIPFDVSKVVYASGGTPNYAEPSYLLYGPDVVRTTCNLFSDNIPQGAQASYLRADWDRWLNDAADLYGLPPAVTTALPA